MELAYGRGRIPVELPDERAAFDAAVRAPIGTRPLRALAGPDATVAIEAPGFALYDQWQAESQALAQRKARVYLHSSLAPEVVRDAMLTPCPDLEATLAELLAELGPGARVAVLPEGPQTVPYLAATA